jgi:hypothetical protein
MAVEYAFRRAEQLPRVKSLTVSIEQLVACIYEGLKKPFREFPTNRDL